MEVRILECEEYPRLVGMAEEFYVEGKIPGRMLPDKFLGTWNNLHEVECGVIFGLLEGKEIVGALGAMTYPDLYDGDLVASEMFWFVNDEHRGRGLRLFNAFEAWAEKRGAKRITMIHLINLSPETLTKLYTKRGYREIEKHYLKDL